MSVPDLIIRGAQIVSHDTDQPRRADIAITDGRVVEVGESLGGGAVEFDASGLLAFPGVVDAHQHWGIYNPLDQDTVSESRACAQGGVTTGLTYIRTGQYYLNRGGPYRDFMPEVHRLTEGRSHVDFAFHVAPMMKEHIDEMPALVTEEGIASFKIFMFYGSHGLHGRSDDQASFLMTPPDENYDVAQF